MKSFLKRLSAFFTAILLAFVGYLALATTAGLTWDPPTQNTDGSALTDLAGYKIYRQSNGVGGFELLAGVTQDTTSYQDLGLANGIHCYHVTAFDETGNEGPPSNEACKTIDTILPGSPGNLRISDNEPTKQYDNRRYAGRPDSNARMGAGPPVHVGSG